MIRLRQAAIDASRTSAARRDSCMYVTEQCRAKLRRELPQTNSRARFDGQINRHDRPLRPPHYDRTTFDIAQLRTRRLSPHY